MKTYVEWFCFLFIIVCVKNVEEVTWLSFNELHYNERYTYVMICSQTNIKQPSRKQTFKIILYVVNVCA